MLCGHGPGSASESPRPSGTPPGEPADDRPAFVVGIGASAGGLESLEALFGAMPLRTGVAFVVIQHLSSDFESITDALLARWTAIPIETARDGEPVAADTIHLLPPGKTMIISGGRLLLADRERSEPLTLPIDHFLRSLAHDQGPRSAAILLSGSGSDGARGVRAVKAAGGLVLAESSNTARFASMPVSASDTGCVDAVLAPAEMPGALLRHVAGAGAPQPDAPPGARVVRPEGIRAALELLRADWQIDFAQYKPTTVTRRIERRLALAGAEDMDAYVSLLRADAGERSALYKDLLIGVTRFFRDAETFRVLETRVLPDLVDRLPVGETFRGWVVGCATGEEAYSIAILLREAFERKGRPADVKLFATDVHRESLDHASAGLYPPERLAEVSEERLRRYFEPKDGGYQVSGELRQMIVFAPHDVIRDAPFTRLDLIACRNLLIYFQPPAQRKAISLFHFGLRTGGCLFLGSSESPGDLADEFEPIGGEGHRLYRKRRDVRLASDLRFTPVRRDPPRLAALAGRRRAGLAALAPTCAAIPLETYDALLDRFVPPALLVNGRRELLDSFGGAHRFLQMRRRRPTGDVIELLRTDARAAIGASLRRAQREGGPVHLAGVTLEHDGGAVRCDVAIEPVSPRGAGDPHFLIGFHEQGAAPRPLPRAPAQGDLAPATAERIRALEEELAVTRESLEATIEALEASNEELQATNEDLVASNEELQSANEELHSVNEELYTVNHEYQKKLAELNVANGDMSHLLAGIEVATIFLDDQLCIRRVTPRASELFDVLPQDVGRRLASFSHQLEYDTLEQDLERCLRRGERIEREVRARGGGTWLLRILPYEADGRPEGVVLTLVDIAAFAATRAELERISAIVDSSDDAILGKTLAGVITSWNHGAERLFGWRCDEVLGRSMDIVLPPERREEERQLLARVAAGERVDHFETQRLHKDGHAIDVSVTISPVYGPDGALYGASSISRDITAQKEAERRRQESEQNYQDLYQHAPDMYLAIDARSGEVLDCNRTTLAKLGYERGEVVGHAVLELYAAASRPLAEAARERLIEVGEVRDVALQVVRRDGSPLDVSLNATAVRDPQGRVVRVRAVWRDVTAQRRAESGLREEIRRREHFLAVLSHELRNPMNALQTAIALLEDGDAEAATHARGVIRRQLRHMARLLDDLLDVARMTQDKIELRRERVDLRAVCREAIETVAGEFRHRGVELDAALGVRPVVVDGDPARLQQVLINLLSNAARHAPSGSRVDLVCERSGPAAVLRVRDRGAGIPRDMLERIFDAFHQLEGSDRPAGGMGLGLTLVRSIVNLHGGRVAAESDGPGSGSTFTVELPLAAGAAARRRRRAAKPAADGLRVVIVEDLEDSRVGLEALLRLRGCEVWSAADAASGTETIRRCRPDVALVDIGLPDAPGYEVARRVRAEPALVGTWLVALTGYGQQGDIERALEAGFDEHMVKPLDLERLGELLASRAAARR